MVNVHFPGLRFTHIVKVHGSRLRFFLNFIDLLNDKHEMGTKHAKGFSAAQKKTFLEKEYIFLFNLTFGIIFLHMYLEHVR